VIGLKPSERRALEAEKRAMREAADREREHEERAKKAERKRSASGADGEQLNANADFYKLPEENIEVKGDGHHREGFFQSHVRLITFIITVTLLLTVIGPWGIDKLVDATREEILGKDVENKTNLTLSAVVLLSDMGYDMGWSSLEKFNYTDYSFEKEGKTTYLREYEIEGTSLVLRVGGPSLTSSPDYVRLIDYFNGESVDDIRKESITAFIEKYQ
jgi:hypothetical protein